MDEEKDVGYSRVYEYSRLGYGHSPLHYFISRTVNDIGALHIQVIFMHLTMSTSMESAIRARLRA
jgi:hypothetical protein